MRQNSLTETLHFDDGPLTAVLTGPQDRGATPADALRDWRHSDTPPAELTPAVAAILANEGSFSP